MAWVNGSSRLSSRVCCQAVSRSSSSSSRPLSTLAAGSISLLVGGPEVAVRADRARGQLGLDERGTALELVELVLEGGELAGRHQGDRGQRTQGDETRVLAQGGLGLVLGDAEPGLCMAGHVGGDVVLLERGEALPEYPRHAVRSGLAGELVEDLLPGGLGVLVPGMTAFAAPSRPGTDRPRWSRDRRPGRGGARPGRGSPGSSSGCRRRPG